MQKEDFQQWDNDELCLWLSAELGLMPDEDKLRDSGLDGATLSMLRDDESQLEEIGLGSPTSKKTALDAITELLQKYGDEGEEEKKDAEIVDAEEDVYVDDEAITEEELEEAPHDMVMKQEMWLEHLYQNINHYEMDPEPADHRLKVLLYHLHEREAKEPKYQEETSKREALESLAGQLRKEGRYGNGVHKIFEVIHREFLNNSGEEAFSEGLKRLLFEIEPFNIGLFRSLAAKTEAQLQKVQDKVILLLLGPTGGGKSTTIQWLCGSKLVKTRVKVGSISLSHIGVAKDGYPEGHDPELERVALSPFSVSETSFIRVIKTSYSSGFSSADCYIVDSPGLEDSRGEELNVANIYGLVQAARVCKKVIPIIVLSQDSMGNRCVQLKDISRNIAGLIHNPAVHMEQLSYLFTKFESSPKGQELLNSTLREVYMNLNEKDKSDQHYMRFWTAMSVKVATPEQILIADPLNSEKSKAILTKLVNSDKIEDPMDAFQMSLGDKSLNLIKAQIHEDKSMLQKFALPAEKYQVIRDKLENIQSLVASLTGQVFIEDCFNEIVQVLKDPLNQLYEECQQMTENAKNSVDVLRAEVLDQIATSKSKFSEIYSILQDFDILEQGGLNPKSFDSLREQLALGYVAELRKLQARKNGIQNNYLRDSNTQRILSSLAFLAENTKEAKLQKHFDTEKQNIVVYLSELVDTILSHTEKGSYPEAVSSLNLFCDSKANLETLHDEHLELEEKIGKNISQTIQTIATTVRSSSQQLKPDTIQKIKEVVASFEPQWNQLKAASTSELFMTQMQPFEIDLKIKTCVDEIQSEFDSKYQASFDKIQQKCLTQEEEIDLSSFGKLENQMNLINVMSQALTTERAKQSNPQQLVNNIQASTQQQFLRHQSNLGQLFMQDKNLDSFLQQLCRSQWIDGMYGDDFFKSKHEEILAKIKEFETRQKEECKRAYGRSDFCQLIQILRTFQSLGSSHDEQSMLLIKEYKTKITGDWIEPIELYQNREETTLDLIMCQMYVEFFMNFDDQENIFEMNNQMDQKQNSFNQYLKATAKKNFAVISIESCETVRDVESNLAIIRDLARGKTPMAPIIDAEALQESMISEICKKFQQLSIEQMELMVSRDREKTRSLLSKVDVAMQLIKYVDQSRDGYVDLMALRTNVMLSLSTDNEQEEQDLFKALRKFNFIEARSSVLTILQNQPRQIQNRAIREVRLTLNQLSERLEQNQRKLTYHSPPDNFIAISDDIKLVDDANQQFTVSVLGELEAQRESEEEKDPASEAAKHLKSVYKQIEETQKSANECAKKSKDRLNLTFEKLLARVDMQISVKRFKEALALNQKLSDIEQSLDSNILSPETVAKIQLVDSKVSAGIESAVQYFLGPPEFETFLYDSFADFIDSLNILKGEIVNAHFSAVDAIKRVNKKFIDRIHELRREGLLLKDGPDNQELNLIERALVSLTEQQRVVIRSEIDSLRRNYKQKRNGRFQQVNGLISNECSDLAEIDQFVKECRMNNETSELATVETTIRNKVGPCAEKISKLIESSQQGDLSQLTATFHKYNSDLGKTFTFFPQYETQIRDALDKKHNKIKGSLSQCLSAENSVLSCQSAENSAKFAALIEDVKFMREIQKNQVLKNATRDEEMEQLVAQVEESAAGQAGVQAELDEELTGLVSYDNKAAIGDDLVKSINTQIIVQENLDSLSGLFVAAPDSAKKPSSEALLDRLQRQFQAIVAIFDEPFASRDLTTEGDIKTLYYRMEISHRNLLYLEQIKSDRLKVNLNHEECQVNSNLRSKTQALLVAQIQAHSEVINQSLADLGDALPAPDLAMDIDHFNNHLRLFLESFQALEFQTLKSCTRAIRTKFQQIVDKRKDVCSASSDVEEFTQTLLEFKSVSDNSLTFKATLDQKINEVLENCKQQKQFDISVVAQRIDDSEDPSSASLLEEHETFKANVIALINSRIQNPAFGIDYVLEEIAGYEFGRPGGLVDKFNPFGKAERKESKIDTEHLRSQYDNFLMEYGSYDAARNKFSGLLGRFLRPKPKIHIVRQELLELAREVKINKAKLTIRKIDQDKIPKILAYIFSIWTIEASESHFEQQSANPGGAEKNFLRTPHAAQVIAIMRILGMGNFKKDPVLSNHLVEVLTGQGKSLIMAVTSATLALLGADCYCACYSQYLSERDFADFKSLFFHLDILDKVHYGTMEKLCESVINDRGSIREQTQWVVGKRSQGPIKVTTNQPIKVLLIDEVDVFFGASFYGNTYQPSLVVKDKCIQDLIKFIWEQRANNLSFSTVYTSEQFKACEAEVPNFKELLMEGVKDMLFDVKEIDNHKEYIVDKERIGYLNGDQYVFTASLGYLTQFAYIREHEQSSISEESLNQNLGLRINCGAYSFAKIPEQFNLILGVTGTLKNVTETQRDIITRVYKILEETYMPSVFGKSNLRYNHKDNFIVVSREEYWSRIRKEIDTQLQGSNGVKNTRAVLVIFEHEKALKEFQLSVHCQEIRSQIKIIAESSGIEQAAQIIKLSTRQGSITLMTRNFGRGTDFSCKDDRVNNQGGVAIIQTFLSESQSEDAQIRGRVARQGQDGSYSLALHGGFLESVNIQEADILKCKEEGNMGALFQQIMDKLNENQNLSQIENNKNVEQANKEHQVSEEFLNNMYGAKIPEVIQQLLRWNKGRSTSSSSKTMILIDATCSMGQLLDQTKSNVQIMLERIKGVLAENGIDESGVLMKIAVYRNYNIDLIYQESSWETDAKNLKQFLNTVSCQGGWGNEALEVGLRRAAEEIDGGLSQVIVIGDAPANTAAEVTGKQNRSSYGREYWDKKLPGIQESAVYVETLKSKAVPIHTLYLQDRAKQQFTEFSASTAGSSFYLNVNDASSADMLVEIVNVQILKSMGNADLLESYKKSYGLQFT